MKADRDTRILGKLDQLTELVKGQTAKIDDLAQRVSRLEGRMEEQSKFLQIALAGRIERPKAAE